MSTTGKGREPVSLKLPPLYKSVRFAGDPSESVASISADLFSLYGTLLGGVALISTSTIIIDASQEVLADSNLVSTSVLTATASEVLSGVVDLTSTSTLSASAADPVSGESTLSSDATLTVSAEVIVLGVVVLTSTSTLGSTSTIVVGVVASLVSVSTLTTAGLVVTGRLISWVGESNEILIPIVLTGRFAPILPEPIPPVDFGGLLDPTVAPTLSKSDTLVGALPAGTYRYSYAAWKDSPGQPTAPSPTADITLTIEDTVTLTYPTIPGANGYLVYREDL